MKEVRFGSNHGSYNLLSPSEQQYNVFMDVVDDDGTRYAVSTTFDHDPLWGNMDPIEVADIINDEIQSHWIDTTKERSREFAEFVHKNENAIRETYYEGEIELRLKKIGRLEEEIIQLRNKISEVWDDMGVE